jgi:hypothetical protein
MGANADLAVPRFNFGSAFESGFRAAAQHVRFVPTAELDNEK